MITKITLSKTLLITKHFIEMKKIGIFKKIYNLATQI